MKAEQLVWLKLTAKRISRKPIEDRVSLRVILDMINIDIAGTKAVTYYIAWLLSVSKLEEDVSQLAKTIDVLWPPHKNTLEVVASNKQATIIHASRIVNELFGETDYAIASPPSIIYITLRERTN